jgi:dTDP-4-dehydrorhamnose 3,5-epimerase
VRTEIEIHGATLTSLESHADERGGFVEIMRAANFPDQFVQANHSRSRAGVLRGLHYHRHQADLWYVVRGRMQVGLADLRERRSPPSTASLVLDSDDPAILYVPPGVAHGFLALIDLDLIYFVTRYFDETDEFGVAWDDPALLIQWENPNPILSERDLSAPPLRWEEIPSFS